MPDLSDPIRPPSHDIPYAEEVKRKALHLFALVVPLGMGLLGKTWSLYLLVPAALFALTADVLRVRSAWFARLIHQIFGRMMRAEELPPVGGPVSINGATWVLVTATLLVFVFPIRIAVAAFVMFMISDAAAALVGRRIGRHRWPGSARTVEGSLGFVAAGMLVMAAFPGVPFWAGALSVVFASVAEALPGPLNDNIRVPLVAAAVLYCLEKFVLNWPVDLFL
jgi:dolichol kinase